MKPLQETIPSPHSLLGFFAYTCGCIIVVEDLHSGLQNHWLGHTEEISTLAVSHDAQVGEASACPGLCFFFLCHFGLKECHRLKSELPVPPSECCTETWGYGNKISGF